MKRIKIIIVGILLITAFILTACDGPTETTCYWCGKTENCYQYCMQYLDGYHPNGDFKYGYRYEFMSQSCANECKNSGKFLNVTKTD